MIARYVKSTFCLCEAEKARLRCKTSQTLSVSWFANGLLRICEGDFSRALKILLAPILIYDALVSYCWGLMGVKIFVWEENCGVRCYTGISSYGSYFFWLGGIYCDSHCNSHMRLWRREGTVSRTNNSTGEMEYLKQLSVFFFLLFVVEQTSEIYTSLREFKVAGTRNLWPLDGPKLAKLS